MDPGHVDFVLTVSEEFDLADGSVTNAMPVSKVASVVAALFGLVTLLLGVEFVAENLGESGGGGVAGFVLITVGCLLIAIAVRSFLLFLHEVLELTD